MTNAGPRDSIPLRSSNETAKTASAAARAATQLDTAQILASVGEVAYDWSIDTDVLLWGANAGEVLLIRDVTAVSSGRAYAQLLYNYIDHHASAVADMRHALETSRKAFETVRAARGGAG